MLNYLPAEDRKRQWGIGNYEYDRDDETAAAIFYCVHEENEEEDLDEKTELFIRMSTKMRRHIVTGTVNAPDNRTWRRTTHHFFMLRRQFLIQVIRVLQTEIVAIVIQLSFRRSSLMTLGAYKIPGYV